MKVYAIEYNNGEPYEDNYTSIEYIFDTYESAKKYLDSFGLVYNEQKSFSYYNNAATVMDGYWCLPDNEEADYDNEEWTIIEYELFTEEDVYSSMVKIL